MPTYVRWQEEGATYFFTVVTFQRRRVLTEPFARDLLRQAFEDVRERLPFEVSALVLLPDHLHCIWTLPADDQDFPGRWRQIKSLFTRGYLAEGGKDRRIPRQARRQRRHGIWQARYYEHRIRDEDDWYRYRDYIHLNPVKHDLVGAPGDWPWSSFHRHVSNGWLDPNWPGESAVALPSVREV